MLKPKFRRPSPALVVATVACVIATGGVAFSAPGGSDGAINACYNARLYEQNGWGDFVITPTADCSATRGDYPDHFSFNATGPAGAAGPTGATGPQGAAGAAGPKGASGVKPVSPKDVKTLQQQVKDVKAAEQQLEKQQEKYKQADSAKAQQQQLDAMLKRIVAMIKELQDQQAQQAQLLKKLK